MSPANEIQKNNLKDNKHISGTYLNVTTNNINLHVKIKPDDTPKKKPERMIITTLSHLASQSKPKNHASFVEREEQLKCTEIIEVSVMQLFF